MLLCSLVLFCVSALAVPLTVETITKTLKYIPEKLFIYGLNDVCVAYKAGARMCFSSIRKLDDIEFPLENAVQGVESMYRIGDELFVRYQANQQGETKKYVVSYELTRLKESDPIQVIDDTHAWQFDLKNGIYTVCRSESKWEITPPKTREVIASADSVKGTTIEVVFLYQSLWGLYMESIVKTDQDEFVLEFVRLDLNPREKHRIMTFQTDIKTAPTSVQGFLPIRSCIMNLFKFGAKEGEFSWRLMIHDLSWINNQEPTFDATLAGLGSGKDTLVLAINKAGQPFIVVKDVLLKRILDCKVVILEGWHALIVSREGKIQKAHITFKGVSSSFPSRGCRRLDHHRVPRQKHLDGMVGWQGTDLVHLRKCYGHTKLLGGISLERSADSRVNCPNHFTTDKGSLYPLSHFHLMRHRSCCGAFDPLVCVP